MRATSLRSVRSSASPPFSGTPISLAAVHTFRRSATSTDVPSVSSMSLALSGCGHLPAASRASRQYSNASCTPRRRVSAAMRVLTRSVWSPGASPAAYRIASSWRTWSGVSSADRAFHARASAMMRGSPTNAAVACEAAVARPSFSGDTSVAASQLALASSVYSRRKSEW